MKIGYLCVAGSLGWGYYEKDNSDIDLRGVYYLNDFDKYIGTNSKQTEFKLGPLENVLWSFDKFWGLLMKSNPTTIEWLLSPCIFSDELFLQLRNAIKNKHYNEYKLAKHYISMAKQNYKKYETNLTEKKCVYIMRGILNARQVADGELPIMNMKGVAWDKDIDWWSSIEQTDAYVEKNAKRDKKIRHIYRDIFKNFYESD